MQSTWQKRERDLLLTATLQTHAVDFKSTFLISCDLYLHDTLDFFTYCNYGSNKLELHVWALKHLSILT